MPTGQERDAELEARQDEIAAADPLLNADTDDMDDMFGRGPTGDPAWDEAMADFRAEVGASDDDVQGGEASDDLDPPPADGTRRTVLDEADDMEAAEGGETAAGDAPAQTPEPEARVVQRLAEARRRVTDLTAENRELRRLYGEASGRSRRTGDVLEDSRRTVTDDLREELGRDPTSDEVLGGLRRLGQYIVAELNTDDPRFARVREQRIERARQRKLETEVQSLHEQRRRDREELERGQAVQNIGVRLSAVREEYPYLHAAEGETAAARTVWDGVEHLILSGRPCRSPEDVDVLMAEVASAVEAEYRRTAERLSRVGGSRDGTPIQTQTRTTAATVDRAARPQGRGGSGTRDVPSGGVGRRAAPPAIQQDDRDRDPFDDLLQEELAERERTKRAAAKRR